jgi:hypothetical protein
MHADWTLCLLPASRHSLRACSKVLQFLVFRALIRFMISVSSSIVQGQTAKNVSFHDHVFEFLKSKVGNFQSVIAEWGYNLLEGVRRCECVQHLFNATHKIAC